MGNRYDKSLNNELKQSSKLKDYYWVTDWSVVLMSLGYLWAHGTTLWIQPFAYFAPILSITAFIIIVYIITSLKQVLDNKNQHILW